MRHTRWIRSSVLCLALTANAVTDSAIASYSYGPVEGVAVFNRTATHYPDGSIKNETFTAGDSFDPNSGVLFGAAVDMKNVLDTVPAQ